jgi:glycosyltransferase involved in cell wall biosynthesis
MTENGRVKHVPDTLALTLDGQEPSAAADGEPQPSSLGPVSVVLPCFDEEGAVRAQVESVRRLLTQHGIEHEIIVVDDGSQDRTAQEAVAARARVLRHQRNRGYGASIKSGMLAARYDTIVISDSDGTYPVEEIPALLRKLESADMVVAARTGPEVHIPWERRPAKWILGVLAELVAGQRIPDLNSGLRAFRRDCLKQYFPILSNRFSFTTTSTLALMADDYHVVYRPINYRQRIGKSKINPRHFLDFMILILRISMMFQPLKIFVPLALTFMGAGAAKSVFDIWALFVRNEHLDPNVIFYPVLSTSAVLLLITGLQLLFIGMLADAIVRRIVQHNVPLLPSRGLMLPEAAQLEDAPVLKP